MKLYWRLTPKIFWKSLTGGISAGLLSIAFTYMIIAGFHLPVQLIYPIGFVFVIIFIIIINVKPNIFYLLVGLFICAIGALVIFLSQNKAIASQIPWDPGLLGTGVSIGALGFSFLSYVLPLKTQSTNKNQISNRKYQNLENSVSKLDKKISLLQNDINSQNKINSEMHKNINDLTKTTNLILKKLENIKFKVIIQKLREK